MKTDVLAIAAIIFVAGIVASSFTNTDDLFSKDKAEPPTELQRGFTFN